MTGPYIISHVVLECIHIVSFWEDIFICVAMGYWVINSILFRQENKIVKNLQRQWMKRDDCSACDLLIHVNKRDYLVIQIFQQ